MAESPVAQRWFGRFWFVVLALGLMFLQLLPLQTIPRTWAPPDMMLAITLAWVARRPDLVPAMSIVFAFLLADLLFLRPPGLLALVILLATEFLRARSETLRSGSFAFEWITVALIIVAITLGNRAIIAVTASHQAPLALAMFQMMMTILAYPAAVLVSYLAFGIRRPALGEVDAFGRPV
jgi:rod shape-determining protein MreD